MKLAEALILRADCNKRFEQLKQRIIRSAMVQEGDEPPENPLELIKELENVSNELSSLIRRINRTNSLTKFQEGMTLSDALAERDVLLLKREAYNQISLSASVRQDRYSKSEVKYKAKVNVQAIQKQIDELSKAVRELDSRIQETNWKIELME
ncbi:MAG TPA: DIP1984 family protein [Pyrinomonadaceae bacterium]|jgi:hypothetical protein